MESQQAPRQFYSGQVIAAIAVLPALKGGKSPTASAGAQEGSKLPVLPGHALPSRHYPSPWDGGADATVGRQRGTVASSSPAAPTTRAAHHDLRYGAVAGRTYRRGPALAFWL